jgi:NitT/TauT family transport system substrate-binding protein
MARTPQVAFGYSVKAMPGSPQVQDLKGKKIGVSATGTLTHMVASQIVLRAGLSPSDVSFVSVGSSAGALASLRSGQIDALCNTDPVMTALEQKGEIQLAFDTRTLLGSQAVFGGPMPTACLHAPVDFVQRHPHTIQAMTNAVVRALRWLHGVGPSELIRTVPEALLWEDRGLYLSAFNRMREAISLDGLMPDDGPRTVLRTWERFDPLLRFDPLELARTYTNEFARRANDRPLKTLTANAG